MKYNIPFIKPSFPYEEEIAKDYTKIVESNWFTNFGPYEQKFRKQIETYIGQETTAVTFNNATSALMAAIIAKIGQGDGSKYIVMPAFTFVAGAQAIIWCGYKPFFADIDEFSLQMDCSILEDVIIKNQNIVAILFCNVFGIGNPEISEIESISKKNKLPLIIDSAAGFGSKYVDGLPLGARGDCEIFSFHATKPFAVGEGGAILTRDAKFADKLKQTTNFGFGKNRDAEVLGFNAKMQEFNAALGLLQLKRFDKQLKTRQITYAKYQNSLKEFGFRGAINAEKSSLGFAALISPKGLNRDDLIKFLNTLGIQAREYYNPPIHKQYYFWNHTASFKKTNLNSTDNVCERIISLPVHDRMSSEDIESIINEIINYIKSDKQRTLGY